MVELMGASAVKKQQGDGDKEIIWQESFQKGRQKEKKHGERNEVQSHLGEQKFSIFENRPYFYLKVMEKL